MKIGILLPSIYMRHSLASKRVSSTVKLSLATALSNELVKLGHEVFVFGPQDINTQAQIISTDEELLDSELSIDEQQDLSSEALNTVSLYERKKYYEMGVTARAYEFAKQNNLDVMHHFHSLGYLSHYFADNFDFPTVFTIHNPPPSPDTLTYYRFDKFAHHPFIAISDSHKTEYKTAFPHMNIAGVIYHGVDCNDFPFSETSQEYLSFIGRATPDKGLDTALEVSIALGKDIHVASWITEIVKNTSYYRSTLEPLLDHDNVTMRGLLPPDERNEFLKQSKAFLFPLRWSEPFGMVLLEAMATGTPVIAYANGSLTEIIEDGVTGFIVNMDDEHTTGNWIVQKKGKEGIIEAVKMLYGMPKADYIKMRRSCRAAVMNRFSEEVMAQHHVDLYTSLISSK